ncbi:hypothetical protein THAOC_24602, partial [Thalassiosira oceanica]
VEECFCRTKLRSLSAQLDCLLHVLLQSKLSKEGFCPSMFIASGSFFATVHAAVLDEATGIAVLKLGDVAPLLAAVGADFVTVTLAIHGHAAHDGGSRPLGGDDAHAYLR